MIKVISSGATVLDSALAHPQGHERVEQNGGMATALAFLSSGDRSLANVRASRVGQHIGHSDAEAMPASERGAARFDKDVAMMYNAAEIKTGERGRADE